MATSFEDLPYEIILRIFLFFTPIQLSAFSLVCKDWWIISKDPQLWKAVTIEFSKYSTINCREPDLRTLQRWKQDILEFATNRVVSNQRGQRIANRLQQCTLLEQLVILNTRKHDCYSQSKIPSNLFSTDGSNPSLKTLLFIGVHLKRNVIKQAIKNYPLIENLSFENCTLDKHFSTVNFATFCATLFNLRELIIINCGQGINFDDICIGILCRGCPRLESLTIDWANVTEKGVMEIAMNSNKTLKKLKIWSWHHRTMDDLFVPLGSCKQLISLEFKAIGFIRMSEDSFKVLNELPNLKHLLHPYTR